MCCKTISSLFMIDCIFAKNNLVSLPFQYTVLCLGSGLSHLLWTSLFCSCILAYIFLLLLPWNFFLCQVLLFLSMYLLPDLMCTYFSLSYVTTVKYVCLVDLWVLVQQDQFVMAFCSNRKLRTSTKLLNGHSLVLFGKYTLLFYLQAGIML